LAAEVRVVRQRGTQVAIAVAGILLLGAFLIVHVWKDVSTPQPAWYFHSTPVWIGVMALASAIYARELGKLRRRGVDVAARFSSLPPE
jgi:uncharacterized membrane protein